MTYMYDEWAEVDTLSHEDRMERLRDWQVEYLESLAAEESSHFAQWELELGPLFRNWLEFLT